METVLKGVSDYLISADTSKKFKQIVYSEFLDEMINKNQTPFIDVIGLQERKTPLSDMSMKKAYRQFYDISIVIVQDAKVTKDIIQGTKTISSIWSLSEYVYDLISADITFNGTVNRLHEKEIISKLTTLTKDNSVKLALEMELTLIKDIFK